MCLMLPVSLDCLRPVSYVANVASISGLFVSVLCLLCLMLPVSLDCLRPVSYVSNVASISGLSILDWFSLTLLLSFLCCVFSFICLYL
jgi:hypothetical protein